MLLEIQPTRPSENGNHHYVYILKSEGKKQAIISISLDEQKQVVDSSYRLVAGAVSSGKELTIFKDWLDALVGEKWTRENPKLALPSKFLAWISAFPTPSVVTIARTIIVTGTLATMFYAYQWSRMTSGVIVASVDPSEVYPAELTAPQEFLSDPVVRSELSQAVQSARTNSVLWSSLQNTPVEVRPIMPSEIRQDYPTAIQPDALSEDRQYLIVDFKNDNTLATAPKTPVVIEWSASGKHRGIVETAMQIDPEYLAKGHWISNLSTLVALMPVIGLGALATFVWYWVSISQMSDPKGSGFVKNRGSGSRGNDVRGARLAKSPHEIVETVFDQRRFWATTIKDVEGNYLSLSMNETTWRFAGNNAEPMFDFFIGDRIHGYKGYLKILLNDEGQIQADESINQIEISASRERKYPWIRPLLAEWIRSLDGLKLNDAKNKVFAGHPVRQRLFIGGDEPRRGVPIYEPRLTDSGARLTSSQSQHKSNLIKNLKLNDVIVGSNGVEIRITDIQARFVRIEVRSGTQIVNTLALGKNEPRKQIVPHINASLSDVRNNKAHIIIHSHDSISWSKKDRGDEGKVDEDGARLADKDEFGVESSELGEIERELKEWAQGVVKRIYEHDKTAPWTIKLASYFMEDPIKTAARQKAIKIFSQNRTTDALQGYKETLYKLSSIEKETSPILTSESSLEADLLRMVWVYLIAYEKTFNPGRRTILQATSAAVTLAMTQPVFSLRVTEAALYADDFLALQERLSGLKWELMFKRAKLAMRTAIKNDPFIESVISNRAREALDQLADLPEATEDNVGDLMKRMERANSLAERLLKLRTHIIHVFSESFKGDDLERQIELITNGDPALIRAEIEACKQEIVRYRSLIDGDRKFLKALKEARFIGAMHQPVDEEASIAQQIRLIVRRIKEARKLIENKQKILNYYQTVLYTTSDASNISAARLSRNPVQEDMLPIRARELLEEEIQRIVPEHKIHFSYKTETEPEFIFDYFQQAKNLSTFVLRGKSVKVSLRMLAKMFNLVVERLSYNDKLQLIGGGSELAREAAKIRENEQPAHVEKPVKIYYQNAGITVVISHDIEKNTYRVSISSQKIHKNALFETPVSRYQSIEQLQAPMLIAPIATRDREGTLFNRLISAAENLPDAKRLPRNAARLAEGEFFAEEVQIITGQDEKVGVAPRVGDTDGNRISDGFIAATVRHSLFPLLSNEILAGLNRDESRILVRGFGDHPEEIIAMHRLFPKATLFAADAVWSNILAVKKELDSRDDVDKTKIKLIHGNFAHLPIEDGSIDMEFSKAVIDRTLAFSGYTLQDEIRSWARDSKRLLKPKGVHLTTNASVEYFEEAGFYVRGAVSSLFKDFGRTRFVAALTPTVFSEVKSISDAGSLEMGGIYTFNKLRTLMPYDPALLKGDSRGWGASGGLANSTNYPINRSPWSRIENVFNPLLTHAGYASGLMGIIEDRLKRYEGSHRRLTILDWGAGAGTALGELSQRLSQLGSGDRTRLIGFSQDIYMGSWEKIMAQGVYFDWARHDQYSGFYGSDEIDIIYSHAGLAHLNDYYEDGGIEYLSQAIGPSLRDDGLVLTELTNPLEESQKRYLENDFEVISLSRTRFSGATYLLLRKKGPIKASPLIPYKTKEVAALDSNVRIKIEHFSGHYYQVTLYVSGRSPRVFYIPQDYFEDIDMIKLEIELHLFLSGSSAEEVNVEGIATRLEERSHSGGQAASLGGVTINYGSDDRKKNAPTVCVLIDRPDLRDYRVCIKCNGCADRTVMIPASNYKNIIELRDRIAGLQGLPDPVKKKDAFAEALHKKVQELNGARLASRNIKGLVTPNSLANAITAAFQEDGHNYTLNEKAYKEKHPFEAFKILMRLKVNFEGEVLSLEAAPYHTDQLGTFFSSWPTSPEAGENSSAVDVVYEVPMDATKPPIVSISTDPSLPITTRAGVCFSVVSLINSSMTKLKNPSLKKRLQETILDPLSQNEFFIEKHRQEENKPCSLLDFLNSIGAGRILYRTNHTTDTALKAIDKSALEKKSMSDTALHLLYTGTDITEDDPILTSDLIVQGGIGHQSWGTFRYALDWLVSGGKVSVRSIKSPRVNDTVQLKAYWMSADQRALYHQSLEPKASLVTAYPPSQPLKVVDGRIQNFDDSLLVIVGQQVEHNMRIIREGLSNDFGIPSDSIYIIRTLDSNRALQKLTKYLTAGKGKGRRIRLVIDNSTALNLTEFLKTELEKLGLLHSRAELISVQKINSGTLYNYKEIIRVIGEKLIGRPPVEAVESSENIKRFFEALKQGSKIVLIDPELDRKYSDALLPGNVWAHSMARASFDVVTALRSAEEEHLTKEELKRKISLPKDVTIEDILGALQPRNISDAFIEKIVIEGQTFYQLASKGRNEELVIEDFVDLFARQGYRLDAQAAESGSVKVHWDELKNKRTYRVIKALKEVSSKIGIDIDFDQSVLPFQAYGHSAAYISNSALAVLDVRGNNVRGATPLFRSNIRLRASAAHLLHLSLDLNNPESQIYEDLVRGLSQYDFTQPAPKLQDELSIAPTVEEIAQTPKTKAPKAVEYSVTVKMPAKSKIQVQLGTTSEGYRVKIQRDSREDRFIDVPQSQSVNIYALEVKIKGIISELVDPVQNPGTFVKDLESRIRASSAARLAISDSSPSLREARNDGAHDQNLHPRGVKSGGEEVAFLARVYKAQGGRVGEIVIGSITYDLEKKGRNLVIKSSDGDEDMAIHLPVTDIDALPHQREAKEMKVTMSIADFTRLYNKTRKTAEAIRFSQIDETTDALVKINLDSLYQDSEGFSRVLIPLLIQEMEYTRFHTPWGKSAQFLLMGADSVKEQAMNQIKAYFESKGGQDFIFTDFNKIDESHKSRSVWVTAPHEERLDGQRFIYLETPIGGAGISELPNYRLAFREALAIARIEGDLEMSNPQVKDLLSNIIRDDIHSFSEKEFIGVISGQIRDYETVSKYALLPLARVTINEAYRMVQMAARMAAQSA